MAAGFAIARACPSVFSQLSRTIARGHDMLMQQTEDAGLATGAVATPHVPVTTCLTFGLATLGTAMMANAIVVYVPAMMVTVLGQSAATAGLLLMVSKLYDAVFDIMIGTLSDRTRTRWGRRRPYMLAGTLVSAVSFIMIFAPPVLTGGTLILYMGAALIVYSTGYSLFNVPYTAMPAEVLKGYHERTRVLSWRSFFAGAGQLAALSGTAWVVGRAHGSAAGYATMAMLGAVIVLFTLGTTVIGSFGFPEVAAPPRARARATLSFRDKAALILSNRPFVLLMAAKFVHFIALSGLFGCTLLFNLYVLHSGYHGQLILSLSQNIVSCAVMPFWVWLSRRIGKRWTYIAGIVCFSLASMTWLLAAPGDGVWTFWARGALLGFGAAGMILMSFAILPDVMEYDQNRSGLPRAGLYASIYSIFEKLGFATGPALFGIYLTAAGLLPSTHGKIVAQPHSAIVALYAGTSIIPVALLMISIVCLLFYPLDERMLILSRQNAVPPAADPI
jgi:GPH family glycoside/pentoside/hexuronide:cation symporter